MAKVIGISGKKQSGKTSLAQYLKARLIQEQGEYEEYEIYQDEEGETFFSSSYNVVNLKEIESSIVQVYSFGDALKEACMYALGLSYEQCYGTDEQKNTFTKYSWENLPDSVRYKYAKETELKHQYIKGDFGGEKLKASNAPVLRSGHLTARDVMQIFGTDICRDMFHDNIWVDATLQRIKKDNVEVAIIADVRFPSEIEAIKNQPKHRFIRLNKNIDSPDTHSSETSLDGFKWQDLGHNVLVVNNENLDMEEKNNLVYNWLFKQKEKVNG